MKQIFFSLIALGLLTSCGGPSKQETTEVCTLSIDPSTVIVNWTAYKTNAKVAVGGTFDSVIVSGLGSGEELKNVLSGASVQIAASSVNSSNVARDEKIKNYFFATMLDSSSISASVKEIDSTGAISLAITLNGITQTIPTMVAQNGDTLTLSSTINLADFEALESIKALNKMCELLHTGEDGVSMLWPEVAISVSAIISKDCK